ncbi:MAG: hypothetical protein ACON5K_04050 [Bacteroidia bacterium]
MKKLIILFLLTTLNFGLLKAQRKKVLRAHITQLTSDSIKLDSIITSLNKVIDVKTQDIKLLELNNSNITKENVQLKKELTKAQEDNKFLKQKIQGLRDSLSNMNQGLDFFEWEINGFTWNNIEIYLKLLLPMAVFENTQPQGDTWISKDSKFKIQLLYNYTHILDEESQAPKFYDKDDPKKYYSKDLQNAETSFNDGYIIKGKRNNEIVFIKYMYSSHTTINGSASGDPYFLWSNTLGIQVTTHEENIEEYNIISELLSKTFNSNSIYSKY